MVRLVNPVQLILSFEYSILTDLLPMPVPAKSFRNVKSEMFEEVYYRVIDDDTGKIVIPYSRDNSGTRCSTDSDGMFFNFKMSSLFPGRVYHFRADFKRGK